MMQEQRTQQMLTSLEGLSVGDAFGQQFMWHVEDIPRRRVDVPEWRWTDDTEMALSIVRILLANGAIEQDRLARSFGEEFDSGRGYGSGMLFELLPRLKAGHDWRIAAPALFEGRGSFGNGAAMRVAPLGAFFAHDLAMAVEQARLSAEVTHAHPEGIIGAMAVVAATVLLPLLGRDLTPQNYLQEVSRAIPESEVAAGILKAAGMVDQDEADFAALELGNGSRVTAQDTVPFCLFVVAKFADHFEEALWQTVAQLGDMDTNCAIVGGILASRTGVSAIPDHWRKSREPLPQWHLTDGHRFIR